MSEQGKKVFEQLCRVMEFDAASLIDHVGPLVAKGPINDPVAPYRDDYRVIVFDPRK